MAGHISRQYMQIPVANVLLGEHRTAQNAISEIMPTDAHPPRRKTFSLDGD